MSKELDLQDPLDRSALKDLSSPPLYLLNSNALMAEDLAMQLGYFGHLVVVMRSHEALMAAMQERAPGAVILDADFGEQVLSAVESIARERRTGKQRFPILLISNRGSFAARLAAARAGADCYFTRPTDIVALNERLHALVLARETHPYRVLLVSDDATGSAQCAADLRKAGLDVRLLQRATEIFVEFDACHPELVIMDVSEPSCSSQDLARLIRQNDLYLDVPIVFLSQDGGPAARMEAIRAGAEDFLVKPIEPVQLVAAVSARVERYRALRGLIMRDSLTGLFNHSALKETLGREMSSAVRSGEPLALAMIDLDYFKRINDEHGHPTGDQVLRTLSRLLQQRLRRSDAIGRYGGEEFAVILPGTSSAAAMSVVDKIREVFSKIRHQADETEFTATFSAGIADITGTPDAEALFRAADAALYRAKHNGRNRIEVAQAQVPAF